MKPFEDSILAEQEEKQARLIALLRHAYQREQTLSEHGQQEAIRRVEERLAGMEESTPLLARQAPEGRTGSSMLRLQRKSGRGRPLRRAVSVLAATLVVGILISSALLLFAQHKYVSGGHGTSGPLAPTSTPDSVDVQWNGLETSMKITPGPYFLGEIISMDLSLTNRSKLTLRLAGRGGNPEAHTVCSFSSLFPEQTGGGSPSYSLYTIPVQFIFLCPDMFLPGPDHGTELAPGQTVSAHFYLLLITSGDVALTSGAYLYIPGAGLQESLPKMEPSGVTERHDSGPLTGHLPILHIHVAPQVPANRMLSVQQKGSEVVIHAPAGAQLVDQSYILCKTSATDRGTPGGDPGAGVYDSWQTLSTSTLQRPACPQINGRENGQKITTHWTSVLWLYAIGAVGYEIVQGQSVSQL